VKDASSGACGLLLDQGASDHGPCVSPNGTAGYLHKGANIKGHLSFTQGLCCVAMSVRGEVLLMGSRSRPRPTRLAIKLLEIRMRLGLTQDELVKHLGLEGEFDQERISKFERAKLEPPLHVLCAYADLANLLLDVLVRDDLALPNELPAPSKLSTAPHQYLEPGRHPPRRKNKK
jgi:transcriptional regulator with XRE-family HTH domain